ncbi:MAG: sugar-binding domain-containing protein [Ignavibacteriaceae bacterium]|jgi:beta-galactosidase
MALHKNFTLFTILLLLFISKIIQPQIVFKELPHYSVTEKDLNFIENSSVRKTMVLNGLWKVYNSKDEEKKKTTVAVPSLFEGNAEVVYEKYFELSKYDIQNNNFELNFLGVSYTAEISINNSVIYLHPGGEFPFSVLLPKDLLKSDKKNVLRVKVNSKLDATHTIPYKNEFLAPERFGGIFRDVYLTFVPNVHISRFTFHYGIIQNSSRAKVFVSANIANQEFRTKSDSTGTDNFEVKFSVQNQTELTSNGSVSATIQLHKGKEKAFSQAFEASNLIMWSCNAPYAYTITAQILQNGTVIDEIRQPVSFYNFSIQKDSPFLNGEKFQLNGVTYFASNKSYGSMMTYEQMKNDLRQIKDLGFNAVRFPKSAPHPYLLSLCSELGLLAFIESPVSSLPENLVEDQNFISLSNNYLRRFIFSYGNYSAVAAIGLGGGFLPNSQSHILYLDNQAEEIRKTIFKPVYASFVSGHFNEIPKLDFIGIEFFASSSSELNKVYKPLQEELGKGKVFISEATYMVTQGRSSGYTNPSTFEAQAKFFSDLLSYSEDNENAGYFINSMFDYRCDYYSVLSQYNDEKILTLGICDENRNTERPAYKVLYAKLHNLEQVTVPIGLKKDKSPMAFIISGLLLALLTGFLINSGRKFREDTSRALLRPYNFFADIRDLRIISGLHTTVLAFIISAIVGTLSASLFFFFKDKILFERFILSIGSEHFSQMMSYLSWHPLHAILTLTIIFFIKLLVISLLVKFFSFFVMNKIFLANAYYTVVWSFLPFVLLIPGAIILYRLLAMDTINLYIYSILFLFCLLSVYRLLKGIYVIYDVSPGKVYFYSIVFLVGISVVYLIVMQTYNATVDFFMYGLKEFLARG